ncbi:MAG: hypothetical protein ACJ79H_22110 [Myxococcales bacterium]
MGTVSRALAQSWRGISAALRSRARLALAVAAAVAAFNLIAPVAVLSLARKPVDFFTFNPWLRRLPDFLLSAEPLGAKLSFLSHLTIAWVSAEGGSEGIDWGFILDVPTLARVVCTSSIFGAYFALWSYRRQADACSPGLAATRPAGVAGALTTVFGLTTGPCSLAGCGAPVLPVLGLAFTGLPGGTLTLFATLSRVSTTMVLVVMTAAVVWSGWRVGAARPAATEPSGPE